MTNSTGGSVSQFRSKAPAELFDEIRYTHQQVAATLGISSAYLAELIRAKRDSKYAAKRSISRSTLADYPLESWAKRGKNWIITEPNLRVQLRRRAA